MSVIGPDGLRPGERWLIEQAQQRLPLPPEQVAKVVRRLGRMRLAGTEIGTTAMQARADAFDEVCTGFAVLHRENEGLRNRVAQVEAALVARKQELAKAHRTMTGLQRELERVRAERDEFRQAARDADAQRIVMQRRVADGAGR